MGMGFMRKALWVATGGLSGLVFKDSSKEEQTAKAATKQVRSQKTTKGTRPAPRAARRRTSGRARKATIAKTVASGNGATDELERLADLHGRGALTSEEFAAAKAKVLGTSPTPDAPARDPAKFHAVEANIAAARHLAEMAIDDRDASVASVSSD